MVQKGDIVQHYEKDIMFMVMEIAKPIAEMPHDSILLYTLVTQYLEEEHPLVTIYFTNNGVYSSWFETIVVYHRHLHSGNATGLLALSYRLFTEKVFWNDEWVPRFHKIGERPMTLIKLRR